MPEMPQNPKALTSAGPENKRSTKLNERFSLSATVDAPTARFTVAASIFPSNPEN
jgi:hypothetical protein